MSSASAGGFFTTSATYQLSATWQFKFSFILSSDDFFPALYLSLFLFVLDYAHQLQLQVSPQPLVQVVSETNL